MTTQNSDNSSSPQSTDDQGQWQKSSELRSVLDEISTSLEGITTAYTVFEERSEQLVKFPSQEPTFQQDVEDLHSAIQEHEDDQMFIIDSIKNGLHDNISREVESALCDQPLPSIIREETAKMVKDEVDEQVMDFLPVSLQEMAEESKRQLREITISLDNSRARLANSNVEIKHLCDPLRPVLTASGERSPLYPQNVQMLLDYDLPKAKALSMDYGLTETDDLHTNLQQFLKHIGTHVDVVIPEEVGLDLIG